MLSSSGGGREARAATIYRATRRREADINRDLESPNDQSLADHQQRALLTHTDTHTHTHPNRNATMVTFSKKTLCLALCALAAGNAMADDWWGNEWWGNSASVSSKGSGSDAYADAGHWPYNSAEAASGTASAASALATDKVQGSNTIAGSGALAEGVGHGAESKADVDGVEVYASTGNYHGGTDSYSDSDSYAYWNVPYEHERYTGANGDADFYADGYGEDIVGAMGGEASVAIAEESVDKWYRPIGGAAGLAVSRSKGRQGKDSWYSREALMELDGFLDHATTGEFLTGAAVSVGAGIGLSNALD